MLGIKPQTLVLSVVGIFLVGAFAYGLYMNPGSSTENEVQMLPVVEQAQSDVVSDEIPATPIVSKPSSVPESKPVPPKTNVSGNQTESAQPTTPQSEPKPDVIVSKPYDPGFLASARITPEIPSENERATLPSCEGKTFTIDPVQLSIVTSIAPTGSMNASGVPDYAVVKVVGSGELNKYDIVAPGDVYITHITQENGLSADPEDNTTYFALCKDVIGYVTHVKELSNPIYKMVTDSVCLGKPHVGENACLIKKLELIARGTLLGRVGRIEGSFGFGVIDLRTNRGLSNASSYPVKTNFAACPLAYLANASGFYGKMTNQNSLCSVQ